MCPHATWPHARTGTQDAQTRRKRTRALRALCINAQAGSVCHMSAAHGVQTRTTRMARAAR